jgi:hypothetical protein
VASRFTPAERTRVAVIVLTLLNLAPIAWIWHQAGESDWMAFARAGQNAGTSALLHATNVYLSFKYTPGAAWLWYPFKALDPVEGYFTNAALMLVCAGVSARIAAELYRLPFAITAALVFAWGPTANGIVVGQTSGFGLMLAMLTLRGLAMGSVAGTVIPLGLLCYKPTVALPLIAVLVVHARWREIVGIAVAIAAWYGLSVTATGGDWAFPVAWAQALKRWGPVDFARNSGLFVTIPSLLLRFGAPVWAATGAGLAVAIGAIPMLRRLTPLQAGSAACLIGLVASPHALGYDAVFALPTILLMYRWLRERGLGYVIVGAYLIAATETYTPFLRFDPVMILIFAATGWWIARYAMAAPSLSIPARAVPA